MTIETSSPAPRAPAPVHQPAARQSARAAATADAGKATSASFASLLGGLGDADTGSVLADNAALPADGNQPVAVTDPATDQQGTHGHGRKGGTQDLTGIDTATADADPAAAALAAAMAVAGNVLLRAPAGGTTAAVDGATEAVGASAAKTAISTVALSAAAVTTAASEKGAALPNTAPVALPATAGLPIVAAPASPPSALGLTAVAESAGLSGAARKAAPASTAAPAATATIADGAQAADRAARGRVVDPALAGIDMKLAAGDGAAADGSESLGNIFAQMRHVLAHAAASASGVAAGAGLSAAPAMGSKFSGAIGGAAAAGAIPPGTAALASSSLAFTGAAAAASAAQLQGRATVGGDAASAPAGISSIGGVGAQLAALATGAGEANASGAGGSFHDRRETGAAGGLGSAAPGFGAPAATVGGSSWNDALQGAGGTTGADAASTDFLLQRSPEDMMADRVGAWVNQKIHSAELTMDAGGSPVQVRIALNGSEAHVQFRTDQAETRQMLGSAVGDLRDMLQKEGLLLSGVEVGTTSAGQPQAGNAPQSGAQGRDGRVGAIAGRRAVASGTAQSLPVAAARTPVRSAGKDGAVDVFA
jgi:flagellar hook-length control protein FliK